jgi:YD repeat-containing protein
MHELARGLVPFRCQRNHLVGVSLAAQWQHRFEYFAQRRAVVFGDPAAQLEQFRREGGLFVEQPQHVARRLCGLAVVARQDNPRQLASAERRHHPRAGFYAMAQCFRQRISERLFERDGQRDVAEG